MNPSKVQARKMVLVSCLALAAISVYRNHSSENTAETFRRLWATGVVAFMLSLLADFAPGVAGPFAGLTVLGWFVRDGAQVLDGLVSRAVPQPGQRDPSASGDFAPGPKAPGRGGGGNFGPSGGSAAAHTTSSTTVDAQGNVTHTTQTGP